MSFPRCSSVVAFLPRFSAFKAISSISLKRMVNFVPLRAMGGGSMSKRILVVEDDFDTRYMLSLILKSEGYEVITAADGEGALAVLFDERPDLIITDISMPCLNGIELTRSLRGKAETAGLPI